MNISFDKILVNPNLRRYVFYLQGFSLGLLASFILVAAQPDPQSAAMGSLPDPPKQGQPWTSPQTTLPKFLVNATGVLFEQGVADPRGCEYREVEVDGILKRKGHAFVLPKRADVPGRYAVCWNGLVYPTRIVGEPANLENDIQKLATHLKQAREKAGDLGQFARRPSWSFPWDNRNNDFLVGDDYSPIKLCLLLRLGRADLAESLFAAATNWTPEPRARDLTDYGISYTTLANHWAGSAFTRLVSAHSRGDDVVALQTGRQLARFRDLVRDKFDVLGFPRPRGRNVNNIELAPRFGFLYHLDEIVHDQERRAQMPARTPVPREGGDPTARIAALVRDLDLVNEHQMSFPGSVDLSNSPTMKELIAEGDLAVPALLELVESDSRLTRSVSSSQGDGVDSIVHPVHEAAIVALCRILKTNEFAAQRFVTSDAAALAARKTLASSMRQFWERTRSIPLTERWYQTLLDDSAQPSQWLTAARAIVQPKTENDRTIPRPGIPPLQGEPLRTGKEPSVTALMLRRTAQLERSGYAQSFHDQGLNSACKMAMVLAQWDEKAALPLIKRLNKVCLERYERWRGKDSPPRVDREITLSLVGFTRIRARLGELEALDEYANWLRTTDPQMFEHNPLNVLEPLLSHADRPSMASAAHWLFNDPQSPWVPLLPEVRGQQSSAFFNFFTSPLIAVAGFREGVLASLSDKTPLGTIEKTGENEVCRRIKNLPVTTYSSSHLNLSGVTAGTEHAFRRCDYLALQLSELEGCPQLDLFWPEARRDEGVSACAAYLKRFGGQLTTESEPGITRIPNSALHLRFPILEKPATADDVASNRAIFSLEGQREVRVPAMPKLPQPARWTTLKDVPVHITDSNGVTHQEYDSNGYVWQVEEIRNGDRWERFYGFVGHHVIARVPASEIEFETPFAPWAHFKEGLDVQVMLVDSSLTPYEPGRPVSVVVRIRNRLGVAHSSPTELMRRSPDGKGMLRKGINLGLKRWKKNGTKPSSNAPHEGELLTAKHVHHFEPAEASRTLEPLESFEAMRLNINEWFDLSEPARYHFWVTFDADSGFGETRAAAFSFQVGADD